MASFRGELTRPIPRRDFLRRTGLAAAAVAGVPALLPACGDPDARQATPAPPESLEATGSRTSGFFPILLYCVDTRLPYSNEVISEFPAIARAGFTAIQGYQFESDPSPAATAAAREYLDAAHAQGLKVLMGHSVSLGNGTMTRDLANIRARTSALKDHPALMGWQLYDEPASATPPISRKRLRRAYDTIKALDPDHLVSIAEAVAIDEAYRYLDSGGFDTLMPDNASYIPLDDYVVSRRGSLEKAVRLMTSRGKSVINHVFAYNLARDRIICPPDQTHLYPECMINRYPTREEMRFLVYDCLVLGSDGVSILCHRFNYDEADPGDDISPTVNPSQWAAVKSVVSELKSISPALLTPSQSMEVAGVTITTTGGCQAGVLIKNYQGKTYLFTTNLQDKQNTAQVGLASSLFPNPTVKLLPEGTSIPVQANSFTASWPPYGVRIYEVAPA